MGVGAGLFMYDVVVKKLTFAISSPDEFLCDHLSTTVVKNFVFVLSCSCVVLLAYTPVFQLLEAE